MTKSRGKKMLTGFLFLGSELMKFIYVLICLFILSGLSFSIEEEIEYEMSELEIYEVTLISEIEVDISEYVDIQKFKYGFKNSHIVDYIGIEILEKKYKIISKDYIVLIVGDIETNKPERLIIGLNMVFDEYVFEFANLNVEEK